MELQKVLNFPFLGYWLSDLFAKVEILYLKNFKFVLGRF